ncbi:hypothetical protein [Nocardia nepalensis]|uniref:hypothetical protein n=1 Tax=Nocardia nepalensis TaxID=3375448 RepID=UPI003B68552F
MTRVAVRAVTSGVVGVYTTHTEAWKILRIPTEDLGDYDAEASAIIDDQNTMFVGEVIVVDSDVAGFAAGCSTWSKYRHDDLDISVPTEHDVAAQEHWGCEHTLFGATPTSGWTREADPEVLDGFDATELWMLRTGDCATGQYAAIIARPAAHPDTLRLSVFGDERGALREHVAMDELDAAMTAAVATIVSAIEHPAP